MLTLHIHATDTTQIDENSQLTESESFLKKSRNFMLHKFVQLPHNIQLFP